MTDEKKYTEQDMVLAKRKAHVDCYVKAWIKPGSGQLDSWTAEARKLYPLTVTRPRQMVIGNLFFRLANNKLQWKTAHDVGWWPSTLSVDDLKGYLTGLRDNPTETISADAPESQEGAE